MKTGRRSSHDPRRGVAHLLRLVGDCLFRGIYIYGKPSLGFFRLGWLSWVGWLAWMAWLAWVAWVASSPWPSSSSPPCFLVICVSKDSSLSLSPGMVIKCFLPVFFIFFNFLGDLRGFFLSGILVLLVCGRRSVCTGRRLQRTLIYTKSGTASATSLCRSPLSWNWSATGQ